MKENLYHARMSQSPETIKKFAVMQYDLFQFKGKIICTAFCIISVVIGIALVTIIKKVGIGAFFALAGCLVFSNINAPAEYAANRVIEMFNGHYPCLNYIFSPAEITVDETGEKIKYKSLKCIAEDGDYLYLFSTTQYGFMVKKTTVIGERGLLGLKEYIEAKTNLKWRKPIKMLSFGMKDIKIILKERSLRL